jgi:hypothetical protein
MALERLSGQLNASTELILGPIEETLLKFSQRDFSTAPIAFVSIDVDYYSSTVNALELLKFGPNHLLPRVLVYLDDLEDMSHNSWCGELAAVNEFTATNPMRPIERHTFLRGYRLFKNARWIDHIFQCHVLDHPTRNQLVTTRAKTELTNPYL